MLIYLAGPDVFRPDAAAWAAAARQRVAAAGHVALLPLDNEAPDAPGIYRANLEQIRRADAVLARLDPFRGAEPDSGTCFEVGYAVALGKPVVGYLADARPLAERLAGHYGGLGSPAGGRPVDPQGLAIEDFGLPVNLMLAVPCRIVAGDLDAALASLAADAA